MGEPTPGGLTAGYQAPATPDPLLATIARDALDLLTHTNRRCDVGDYRKIFLDTAPRAPVVHTAIPRNA
jgi:hypothetical protein